MLQACGPSGYGAPQPAAGYGLPPPPRSARCRPDHVDIDCDDCEDPMACTTYVNDIFEYLRESEVRAARWRLLLGGK